MRPLIREATIKSRSNPPKPKKDSNAAAAKTLNPSEGGNTSNEKHRLPPPTNTKRADPPEKSFQKAPISKRVSDVVQAPPELTALPRYAKKNAETLSRKKDLPVSAIQKEIMAEQREKAVKLYRQLRERQRQT